MISGHYILLNSQDLGFQEFGRQVQGPVDFQVEWFRNGGQELVRQNRDAEMAGQAAVDRSQAQVLFRTREASSANRAMGGNAPGGGPTAP